MDIAGVIGAAVVAVLIVAWSVYRSLFSAVTIFEYESALRFDDGRFVDVVGPGRHRYRKDRTAIVKHDVRERLTVVPGQEVLTSDGVSVRISVVAAYEIADLKIAVLDTENYLMSLYAALQLALRDVVGATPIDDLIARRSDIGAQLLAGSASAAEDAGLRLHRVDVRDVMLPGELKRIYAQVVRARQEGLASLERARGEIASLRALANAARMVDRQPSLLQLRTLQQLEATSGNTVVLGLTSPAVPIPSSEPGLPAPAEGRDAPESD